MTNRIPTLRVRVEIPKGSSVKYEYDEKQRELVVDRRVPIPYPSAYGYALNTISDDGDPLDVFIVTEEPLQPGCLVECVPLYCVEMIDNGERDPKVIAVPVFSSERSRWSIDEQIAAIELFLRQYKKDVQVEGEGDLAAVIKESILQGSEC